MNLTGVVLLYKANLLTDALWAHRVNNTGCGDNAQAPPTQPLQ
jgi:hypothetical protein